MTQMRRQAATVFNDRKTFLLAIIVTFGLSFLYGLHFTNKRESTGLKRSSSSSSNNGQILEKSMRLTGSTINYLQCHTGQPYRNGKNLVMLHGAAFSAETWRESGILQKLCQVYPGSSVSALDLPATADGYFFKDAMDNLYPKGENAVIITPSASGRAVVTLAEMARDGDKDRRLWLSNLVRAWVPVASPAINKAKIETLQIFKSYGIPIMSIHGNQDEMGKKASAKLVEAALADYREIEGKHPCYLDSPDTFVDIVVNFVSQLPDE